MEFARNAGRIFSELSQGWFGNPSKLLKAFGVWWSVHSEAREIVGEWEVNVLGTSDWEEEEKVVEAVSAFPSPGIALVNDSLE